MLALQYELICTSDEHTSFVFCALRLYILTKLIKAYIKHACNRNAIAIEPSFANLTMTMVYIYHETGI